MYIDIEPNPNVPEGAMATFLETGPGRLIRAVRLHLEGEWVWCAVVAWGGTPVPAQFTPIEESGDGPARLVSGATHGIRLARIADAEQAKAVVWSEDDADQWGEPFLICTPETEVV